MLSNGTAKGLIGCCLAVVLASGAALGAPLDEKMAAGMAAKNAGDFDGAITAFREAIQMDPNFMTAHYLLGVALYEKGIDQNDPESLEEATKAFQEAARLGPTVPGAHFYLGRIYMVQAMYDKAEAEFKAELRIAAKADRPDVYEALGSVLMSRLDYMAAIKAFSDALDLDHNHAWARYRRAKCYLALKQYDKVTAEMDLLHQQIMDYQSIANRIAMARASGYRHPDYTIESLLEDYSRVAKFVEQDAMWPEVFKLQGDAFSEAGQHSDARNSYSRALSEAYGGNPNDLDVRVAVAREMVTEAEERVRYRGDIQDPYRELEEADGLITEILSINAEFAPALNLRGMLYTIMDEIYYPDPNRGFAPKSFDDAIKVLTQATDIYANAAADPQAHPSLRSPENYAQAERNLGRVSVLKARREAGNVDLIKEGDAHFSRSLELYSDDPLALAYRAEAKADLGQYEEALQAGRDAVRLAPEMAETHTALGYALLLAGQANEAAQEFLVAIKLVPEFVPAWKLLGRAYYDMETWSAAVRTFRSALEHIPVSGVIRVAQERAEILFRMGMAYAKDGYYEDAANQFNAALGLDPSYVDPQIEIAVAYRHLGRYGASLAALDAAKALVEGLPPEGPLARIAYERAATLSAMGRNHDAYVAIHEAMNLRPKDPQFEQLLEIIRSRLTRAPAAAG